MNSIVITKANYGAVVAALHNNTRPLGLGFLHATGPMTPEEGAKECAPRGGRIFMDYVRGRPVKTTLTIGKELTDSDLRCFKRDGGNVAQFFEDASRQCAACDTFETEWKTDGCEECQS